MHARRFFIFQVIFVKHFRLQQDAVVFKKLALGQLPLKVLLVAALARIVELLAHGIVVGTGSTAAPRQTNSIKAFGGSDLIVAIHSCPV